MSKQLTTRAVSSINNDISNKFFELYPEIDTEVSDQFLYELDNYLQGYIGSSFWYDEASIYFINLLNTIEASYNVNLFLNEEGSLLSARFDELISDYVEYPLYD